MIEVHIYRRDMFIFKYEVSIFKPVARRGVQDDYDNAKDVNDDDNDYNARRVKRYCTGPLTYQMCQNQR